MKPLKNRKNRVSIFSYKKKLFKFIAIFGLSLILFLIPLNSSIIVQAQYSSDRYSNDRYSNDKPSNTIAEQTKLKQEMFEMETRLDEEFDDYFQRDTGFKIKTTEEIVATLKRLDKQTGSKSAVIWAMPKEDFLRLVLVTSKGEVVVRELKNVPLELLVSTVGDFALEIDKLQYPMDLTQAQNLYKWIIEPFESEHLQPEKITNLLFCLGNGIRGLPLAALHDGKQFLIEKYSLTRIPAFSLMNTDYQTVQQANILAMGASEFTEETPLPAVSSELQIITEEIENPRLKNNSQEKKLLFNEEFTIENMNKHLSQNDYEILHLATHADFNSGDLENSYIQFWDAKLTLEQMSDLSWKNPPELLVLSACKTALGDEEAELGFTGIALQSGVKSALGSLWYVSDAGTLALISEFYKQLITKNKVYEGFIIPPTKSEALQKAQVSLLKNKVYFKDNRLFLSEKNIDLSKDVGVDGTVDLSHPFYWAAFTLINSPW